MVSLKGGLTAGLTEFSDQLSCRVPALHFISWCQQGSGQVWRDQSASVCVCACTHRTYMDFRCRWESIADRFLIKKQKLMSV